jgi:hypothetical protein
MRSSRRVSASTRSLVAIDLRSIEVIASCITGENTKALMIKRGCSGITTAKGAKSLLFPEPAYKESAKQLFVALRFGEFLVMR